MFANNMYADCMYGSDEAANIGFDINNVQDEILIFEPGPNVPGDNGSTI